MASDTAIFKVQRFDPEVDPAPYFQTYTVPIRRGMVVLEGLVDLLDDQDGSLAFRASCRGAVCGSCAMYINGAFRLACNTAISSLLPREITISPLPYMRVIKDLVVDQGPFWAAYERIKPFLINPQTAPERERYQSPKDRKHIDEMLDCILCTACYSSCPMTWSDQVWLGPAALLKADRFNADSRDQGERERLKVVDNENGVWRCHTVFNCTEACPKKINLTWSIEALKRQGVVNRLKFWGR
ncbi:MAG: succinate dehydrogenase iron-sulfur subunit [Dehalococcoidia bacterium]|nr:succinate dehydrogenase iron-sulfur subunit [Dehalococcoidia bacterium]